MKNILISLILICLFTISAQAQWWEKTTGPREYLYKAYDTKRGKIVGVSERGETWEFSGIAWSLVQKSSPFLVWWNYAAYGGMAYDEARDRMVLYLRNDGNPLILKTYEWDGKIWQLKNKRIFKYWSFGEPIYDRDRKKVIFITSNGYQTKKQHTWAWNGNSWQMLKIANPKKKIESYDIAYDHNRKKIVMVARIYEKYQFINIYELEASGWKQKGSLGEADRISIGYHPVDGRIWIFTDDFWDKFKVFTWDGETVESLSSYPAIFGPVFCDKKNNRLLAAWNVVWELRKNKIEMLADQRNAGWFNLLAYDSNRDRIVLIYEFGGGISEWNGRTWEYFYNRNTPPTEYGRFRYNPAIKRTMYFGGRESAQYPNEDGRYYPPYNTTYLWNGKKLMDKDIPAPEPRSLVSMAYHSDNKTMMLFGGHDMHRNEEKDYYNPYFGGFFNDTWEFKNREWRKITDIGPNARSAASMVYDKQRKKMVLFGGSKERYYGDTWEWDERGWVKVANKGPDPRESASMVFDQNLGKVILFSGIGKTNKSSWGSFTDVWTWDGKEWKEIKQAKGVMRPWDDLIHYDIHRGQSISYLGSFWFFGPYRPTISASTDFNGDGKEEPSSFDARGGEWTFEEGGVEKFGKFRDVPACGDYNGDGRAEKLLFRPRSGEWLTPNGTKLSGFGQVGDVPVPGDYDGDGKDDIAYFRPSIGRWCINGKFDRDFGQGHDVPVPGDYNGDKKTDIAVYRAETGTWYFSNGKEIKFGEYQDIPAPADYNGDGKTDIAVYRQSTGQWLIKGQRTVKFGYLEDVPIPMDYDGDGRDNLILYRPITGEWVFADGSSFSLGKPHSTPVH